MELNDIQGIGEKTVKLLNKKNLFSIDDLLTFYPINYVFYDSKHINNTSNIPHNIEIEGIICKGISEYRPRSNLLVTNYFISNGAQEFKVVAWNQRHLRFSLKVGQKIKLIGKYDPTKNQITQNKVTIIEDENTVMSTGDTITPIYSKITSLSDGKIQKFIINAIKTLDDEQYKTNLLKIHNPTSKEDIQEARTYLKYKEFYKYYDRLNKLKDNSIERSKSYIKGVLDADYNKFITTLPFALTSDQEKVLNNLISSLNSTTKTQSLILGDVGSGKTIVSIILTYLLVRQGFQVAIMAPTEVLTKQLYENYKNYFEEFNIIPEFLTSSLKKSDKNKIKDKLLVGATKVVVGTHALIQDDVIFKNLGLCIIDEQHRFGVEQRNKLINKTKNHEFVYMSATPIPRTLAQSIFGVVSVEFIDTKPSNRTPIETQIFSKNNKKKIFEKLDEQLQKGNQAYVIAPTIEKTEIPGLEDVQSLYNNFSTFYEDKYKVGLIHGAQKSNDKEKIMQMFKNHEFDILVATTVIEVGVDVADATCILIVNAERFGLAQLHQLRGRVGRSDKQSYCLLYDKSNNPLSRERLEMLKQYDNGFILAQKDLELRGYGNFFGKEQSGYTDFKIFNYTEDFNIAQQVIEDYKNK